MVRLRSTASSTVEINRPVNLHKCLRALDACDGVVRGETDQRRDVRDDERQTQPIGQVRSHGQRPRRFAVVDVDRTHDGRTHVRSMPDSGSNRTSCV